MITTIYLTDFHETLLGSNLKAMKRFLVKTASKKSSCSNSICAVAVMIQWANRPHIRMLIGNSSNPSSWKTLELRPYDRPYKVLLLACGANCSVGINLAITYWRSREKVRHRRDYVRKLDTPLVRVMKPHKLLICNPRFVWEIKLVRL